MYSSISFLTSFVVFVFKAEILEDLCCQRRHQDDRQNPHAETAHHEPDRHMEDVVGVVVEPRQTERGDPPEGDDDRRDDPRRFRFLVHLDEFFSVAHFSHN